MSKLLYLEFYKTKRRKVWLSVFLMIVFQLLWAAWAMSRFDENDLQQGWQYVLYQFPMINTIMMPVITAVIASRMADIEHKGQTLKQLETLTSAGRVFAVKYLCCALHILCAIVLQIVIMIWLGTVKGFDGGVPSSEFVCYFFTCSVVSLTILLIQHTLSMLIPNQMISLAVGLLGALAGLWALFFPQQFTRIVVWGYYGLLSTVHMDWNPTTRVVKYSWQPVDMAGCISIAVFLVVLYYVGSTLFKRKEH